MNEYAKFKDWVDDLDIGQCGTGWFVRLCGTDIFDGFTPGTVKPCKPLRQLSIAAGLGSEEEAKAAAIEWLEQQLANVKATA